MKDTDLDVPPAWQEIDIRKLKGIVMVVGYPDTGKSTFARYLYNRLADSSDRVGYIDGDPGQSVLGPPTTITLAMSRQQGDHYPPGGRRLRSFIGATSPAGHMLQVVTGAARLGGAALSAGMRCTVYDTNGLIHPERGGLNLKLSKMELLRPSHLFAMEGDRMLRPLVEPLRRSKRLRVVSVPSSPAVKRRNPPERKSRREENFRQYFRNAEEVTIPWRRFAVFPEPYFNEQQLLAFEDVKGFTLGLGIVLQINGQDREVMVQTPVTSLDRVDTIRLGNTAVNPETFEDRRLPVS